MSVKFRDRVSTYPNRYKLKKFDGTSEFVTLERADEPIVEGTPLNADTFNAIQGVSTARNLLDNSDFTKPVNQRMQTSYSTPNAYSIDRWITAAFDFTLNLTESGLTASLSGSYYNAVELQQRIPKGVISPNKVYTAAVCYAGGNLKLSVLRGEDRSQDPYLFTGSEDMDILCFNLRENETVVWAALYEGEYTVETLPEYQPKGYGAELLECQRYLQVRSTNIVSALDMRPTMRLTNPTVAEVAPGVYTYSAEL